MSAEMKRDFDWNDAADLVRFLEKRMLEFERALKSIAANTCCDRCQEAALVAKAALGRTK